MQGGSGCGPADTPEAVSARVHTLEHIIYPHVVLTHRRRAHRMAQRIGVFRRRAARRAAHRGKRCGCLSVSWSCWCWSPAAPRRADPIDLKPFRATYIAEWKGMTAGELDGRTQARLGATSTRYSSVNSARGMFRMAFPGRVIADQHVHDRRRARRADRCSAASDEKERPINLTFDWQKKRVTGVAKERAVDLELPEGAQDADVAADRLAARPARAGDPARARCG